MAMNRNERCGPARDDYGMRRERAWARDDSNSQWNDREEYQGRSLRDEGRSRTPDDHRFGGGSEERYSGRQSFSDYADYGMGYGEDAGYGGRRSRRQWSGAPGPIGEDEMMLSGRYGAAGMGMTGPRGYDQFYGQRGRPGDWREDAGREDRGFFERAGDEVASWLGDRDAERRRDVDAGHRGRGPKNYARSDDRIREDVSDRLTDDRHLDASNIEVTVSDGEVTLDGTVDQRLAKRHAEDIVESASGVKHVQNNLRIKDRATSTGDSTTGSGGGTGDLLTR